jgi:hypothetical protein
MQIEDVVKLKRLVDFTIMPLENDMVSVGWELGIGGNL